MKKHLVSRAVYSYSNEMKALSPLKGMPSIAAVMIAIASGAYAQSSILVTAQAPGSYSSSLSGGTVNNFSQYDNLPNGVYNNASFSGVGTVDNMNIDGVNGTGGIPSPGVTYPRQTSVGSSPSTVGGTPVNTETLTLNKASSYFGMYWGSMDPQNNITFLNNGTVVGKITGSQVISALSQFNNTAAGAGNVNGNPYNGNPNSLFAGQTPNVPFAYVNFLGGSATSWNQIQFNNTGGAGFEMDGWDSRVNGWNPVVDGALPGTVIALDKTVGGVSTLSTVTSATLDASGNVVLKNGNKILGSFVPAAPGAPAPPMTACLCFAGVLVLQALRRRAA